MPKGVYKHKPLSKEHKRKIGEGLKKTYRQNPELKKKTVESRKGYTHSEKTKSKISKTLMGHTVSKERKGKISKTLKGKKKPPRSAEYRKNISKAHIGMIFSEETRKKISEATIKMWQDPIYREKQLTFRKQIWRNPEFIKKQVEARSRRPNNLELLFDKLTPDSVEYTGNGKYFIVTKLKTRLPDFTIEGENKVIEIFGNYWHKGENPKDIIKEYYEVGYKCLVFWESEVYQANNDSKYLEEMLKKIEI